MIYLSIKEHGQEHFFAAPDDALVYSVDQYILQRHPAAKRGRLFSACPAGVVVHVIPGAAL